MDDLVKRLRRWSKFGYGVEASETMAEAADRIAALEAQLASLREALEPFARAQHIIASVDEGSRIRCILTYPEGAEKTFTLASLEAARQALNR